MSGRPCAGLAALPPGSGSTTLASRPCLARQGRGLRRQPFYLGPANHLIQAAEQAGIGVLEEVGRLNAEHDAADAGHSPAGPALARMCP